MIQKWWNNEEGVAAMEAVMLFPPMLVLLLGVYDLGNGIILAQKTITASQIASDLVSRNKSMDMSGLEEVIQGSKLAFEPYQNATYGIDIVSIRFDENGDPEILWRETRDMSPNSDAVNSVAGLGEDGEGIVIVTVQYTYAPHFSSVFMDDFNFTEVAFSRGRKTSTVTWGG